MPGLAELGLRSLGAGRAAVALAAHDRSTRATQLLAWGRHGQHRSGRRTHRTAGELPLCAPWSSEAGGHDHAGGADHRDRLPRRARGTPRSRGRRRMRSGGRRRAGRLRTAQRRPANHGVPEMMARRPTTLLSGTRRARNGLLALPVAVAATLALALTVPAGASAEAMVHLGAAEVAQALFVAGGVARLGEPQEGAEERVLQKTLQEMYADEPE